MTAIEAHLQFLYGRQVSQQFYPRVRGLIEQHRREIGRTDASAPGFSLTQRDALVITYGDQVGEPGVAPLRILNDFLTTHLEGIVSGVHVLPFYPSSSDDGFAVIDWFAVDSALGNWEHLAGMGRSFDLMFDAVFNHLSARSPWFRKFLADDPDYRDFFVTVEGDPDLTRVVRPRALPLLTEFEGAAGRCKVWTTFSADQVDLNFKNPEVLLAALRALLFYARNGARFIRLDAIAYLWKEIGTSCIHLPQTHRVVQLMRSVLDEASPEVLLITETNVPHTENISYFGNGSDEAQLVYNFALPPLVLHSLATGDASALARWADSLRLPPGRVAFFNFLASHDGIGVNPARGILEEDAIENLVRRAQAHGGFVSYKHVAGGAKIPYELNINYFDALSDPNDTTEPLEIQVNRFIAAQAIMLALAGMPGIYFHSLFGSRNDRAGAEASGMPRRINRQKLERGKLESELADPASLRALVFTRYRQLLRTRREHPAFHPRGGQRILTMDARVFVLLREEPDGKERILCLHNVIRGALRFAVKLPVILPKSHWRDLLSGRQFSAGENGELAIELGPYQVLWVREEHSRIS